ncbi:MAG: transporter substrate-binding domain-containing protein, partial [bacterium]|nr:transporter substrate-binding domain-containing protein [bacterium]
MKNKGFIAEIVSQACSAAGIKHSFEFAPWPRCEANVKHGKTFAAVPYSYNTERAAFADFSKPLSKSRTSFFYKI